MVTLLTGLVAGGGGGGGQRQGLWRLDQHRRHLRGALVALVDGGQLVGVVHRAEADPALRLHLQRGGTSPLMAPRQMSAAELVRRTGARGLGRRVHSQQGQLRVQYDV